VALKLFGGIGALTTRQLLREALAGVSLASMNIPQVLGYARIAGAPIVTGLYTLLLPLVAFAIFGSSRHLVVAADSATAAVFASGLSAMASPTSEQYMALVGIVALLTAGLLLAARLFRLGFLADFLSRTVLVGFLAGVGIKVGVTVLGDMTGAALGARDTLGQVSELLGDISAIHVPTLGVSVAVVIAVFISRRLLPRVPISLIVVILGIVLSYAYDFESRGIGVIGPIASGLPSLRLPIPRWDQLLAVLPVAGSCFVIIVAQSAATARIFAIRHGERVDEDADILGLAAANAAAVASGAFVVSGSLTQTAMGERAGASSQVAQLATAAIVGLVLLFFTGPLQYLPRCLLAAIVFTIAVGLVDVRGLLDMRRESPGEFSLAIVTAAAVVLIGVEQGILLAVALSLLRHVRHSYRPHTIALVPDATGRWTPVPATPGVETEPGLLVYRFGADLFYANENRFADEVLALAANAPHPVRWLLIDAGAIGALDYSAARTLKYVCEELARSGVALIFGRVSAYLRSDMERHGIIDVIGASRIFPTLHEALAAVHDGDAHSVQSHNVET